MLEKILYFLEIFSSTKEDNYIITTKSSIFDIKKITNVFLEHIVFIENPKDFQISFSKDYMIYKEDESD